MNTLKKYLILILLVVINLSCSKQDHYNQKIEKLFKLYNDNSQVNQLKALEYAKQVSLLAENDGDSKGKTYSYIYIARSLLFMGFQKGVLQVQNNPKITKFLQYFAMGNFYYETGDLQQALKYYLLSEKDMELRKWEWNDFRLKTYHQIADIYGKLNNPEKKEFYEQKYNVESTKRLENYNKNIQKTVEFILKEKNKKQSIAYKRSLTITVSIILFIFISSIFAYRKHVDIKKHKDRIIEEYKEQTVILTRNIEKNKFNELIKLAKANNSHFLILFEELYPQFISKLKVLDPKIRNSELSFCAMAYLNFSTKDIAEYTFVTVRAVEKRKSRLRKKYNIPTDEDFNRWMKNLENN